ncbi:MAG: 5-formyltetrahydrofolate cyclo-ligase [Armatimonadota bacterium]
MPYHVQAEKERLRREVLIQRRSLPPERVAAAGELAAVRAAALPEVLAARHVMVYLTYKSELPTEPLVKALRSAGKALYAPRIDLATGTLFVACLPPEATLRAGPYGVSEPIDTPCVPVHQLDVVFVPGVAFDRLGRRLGFGKGYYDRFLTTPGLRAVKVGLAFGVQLVPEVPAGPVDAPVDIVVTESETIRPQRALSA